MSGRLGALVATLALGVFPVSAGCGDGDGDGDTDDHGPWESLADRHCPEASDLSYEEFADEFFDDFCRGCHSESVPVGMRNDAPPGFDFDTLDDIQTFDSVIWSRAADDNESMPPPEIAEIPRPTADDRARLGEWLACGAQ